MSRRTDHRPPYHFLIVALVALVLAVFGQVGNHAFITFDDPEYITENPAVKGGLTTEGCAWAFATFVEANWHPLTWLSHMADVTLFGLSPGPHHLVNVVIHALNAVLLFLAFRKMTGRAWRSAFVAALFAVHPLHVESVAWAAERKDVLSTLCWMLATWAYAGYALRGGIARYFSVIVFFVLGLLSKPMVITLPFVLLLLDFWPLQRCAQATGPAAGRPGWGIQVLRLVVEKIPFFALAIGSGVITYIAQQQGGAIPHADILPLKIRAANAALSYVRYLGKMIWPASLSIYYPHPWSVGSGIPALLVAGSALLLGAASAVALWQRSRRPFMAMGWLWYLGTLVPVIGLVQVGGQSMADRYTYIPLIGIFVVIAWGIPEALREFRLGKHVMAGAAVAALLALAVTSWVRTSYWRDSVTLFTHALKVDDRNLLAYNHVGIALLDEGRIDEAATRFEKALTIAPRLSPFYPVAAHNLGVARMQQQRFDEAVQEFRLVLWIDPGHTRARYNLARTLERQEKVEEAVAEYRLLLGASPDFGDGHANLGALLLRLGRVDEAIVHLKEAVHLAPSNMVARQKLETALSLRRP